MIRSKQLFYILSVLILCYFTVSCSTSPSLKSLILPLKIDGCGRDAYTRNFAGCVLDKYTPPDVNKYNFPNELTVDFPLDSIYQIVKDNFNIYDEKISNKKLFVKIRNNIEVSNFKSRDYVTITPGNIKKVKSGQLSDCGNLIFRPHGDFTLDIYPRKSFYEITLSPKDMQTLINVKFIGASEWYKSQGCSVTEEELDRINKEVNPDCISSGIFEEYAFNTIQGIISQIVKSEEKEKLRQERRYRRAEDKRKREMERRAKEQKEKEQRVAFKNEFSQKFLPKCSGTILSLADFITGKNPYADKGKCSMIQATTFQMTSDKTGLFSISNQIFYIEFPQAFRGSYVMGIAKIKGVYTYPTRFGETKTVPHLELLDELTDQDYYLLER